MASLTLGKNDFEAVEGFPAQRFVNQALGLRAMPSSVWVLMQKMRARQLVLEEQVKLSSRTSSKPPSSDGHGRGSRPTKPKSGRKVSAQPGHQGSCRAMVPIDQVDRKS